MNKKDSLVILAVTSAALAASAVEHATFPAISAPRAITRGPRDHFLANYYAINAWSADLTQVSYFAS